MNTVEQINEYIREAEQIITKANGSIHRANCALYHMQSVIKAMESGHKVSKGALDRIETDIKMLRYLKLHGVYPPLP